MNVELKAEYISSAIAVLAAIAVLYVGAQIATALEDHNGDPGAHAEVRLKEEIADHDAQLQREFIEELIKQAEENEP